MGSYNIIYQSSSTSQSKHWAEHDCWADSDDTSTGNWPCCLPVVVVDFSSIFLYTKETKSLLCFGGVYPPQNKGKKTFFTLFWGLGV